MDKKAYKAVKCAWARSVNNNEYKPYKDDMYGTKYDGKLNAMHFLIYNIIRGMPTTRGFEPLGEGFDWALQRLEYYLRYSNNVDNANNLLFPFEGLITLTMLEDLVK